MQPLQQTYWHRLNNYYLKCPSLDATAGFCKIYEVPNELAQLWSATETASTPWIEEAIAKFDTSPSALIEDSAYLKRFLILELEDMLAPIALLHETIHASTKERANNELLDRLTTVYLQAMRFDAGLLRSSVSGEALRSQFAHVCAKGDAHRRVFTEYRPLLLELLSKQLKRCILQAIYSNFDTTPLRHLNFWISPPELPLEGKELLLERSYPTSNDDNNRILQLKLDHNNQRLVIASKSDEEFVLHYENNTAVIKSSSSSSGNATLHLSILKNEEAKVSSVDGELLPSVSLFVEAQRLAWVSEVLNQSLIHPMICFFAICSST